MKKIIVIIAVALPLAFSARAQWIVYDPTSNIQQILDEAENLAEYASMIDNQVQQITTLGNQLSEFKNYEALFGNPSQVVLSMVAPLDADLQSLEPGLNLENLVANANGNTALTFNYNGIYATVGASFQTPRGQTVQRPADQTFVILELAQLAGERVDLLHLVINHFNVFGEAFGLVQNLLHVHRRVIDDPLSAGGERQRQGDEGGYD